MYKCKECGTEYEIKPDYCDCGNDEFITEEPNIATETTDVAGENSANETGSDKNITEEIPKVLPASEMNFHNYNTYVPKKNISVDPVSLIIFFICIILSIYVIFFAFNGVNNNQNNEIKKNTDPSVLKNIPSIDKIWNNAVPVVKKEEPKEEKKVENIVKQIIPVQIPKKTETQSKNITKVPLKKTTAAQKKPIAAKTVSVANTKQQTTNTSTTEQAKAAAEAAAKQKAEQERKAAEAAQLKKLQEEQAKKLAEKKAKQAQLDKQEFINYKAQLRNIIARKIDFTRVIGDGSCTVAFKIDSNGKLINRSFAKQSSNNTLNDVVYAAIMSTPTFNPPPSAYNNEVLNLNIKFYNGNFEISLP